MARARAKRHGRPHRRQWRWTRTPSHLWRDWCSRTRIAGLRISSAHVSRSGIDYPGAAAATEKSGMASGEQGSAFTPCAGDNNDEDTRTQTGHSFCSRANDRALQGANGEPPDHERGGKNHALFEMGSDQAVSRAQPHTGPACIGGAEGIGQHHPPHGGSRSHLEIPCVEAAARRPEDRITCYSRISLQQIDIEMQHIPSVHCVPNAFFPDLCYFSSGGGDCLHVGFVAVHRIMMDSFMSGGFDVLESSHQLPNLKPHSVQSMTLIYIYIYTIHSHIHAG